MRLGGMALRNGLLVHGPTHWAAAVRTDDGEIKVASGRKPRLAPHSLERVPGLRGVAEDQRDSGTGAAPGRLPRAAGAR